MQHRLQIESSVWIMRGRQAPPSPAAIAAADVRMLLLSITADALGPCTPQQHPIDPCSNIPIDP
jgi:hypothetical protein